MDGGRAERPSRIARLLLTVAGCLAAGLGVAGIFLPLLPTTPFLLLAAACFARSSESLYRRLIESRWTGPYIRIYRRNRGLPRRAKIVLVCLSWATLSVSAYLVPLWWVWLSLAGVGVGVTGFVLSLPTLGESEETRRIGPARHRGRGLMKQGAPTGKPLPGQDGQFPICETKP